MTLNKDMHNKSRKDKKEECPFGRKDHIFAQIRGEDEYKCCIKCGKPKKDKIKTI